jgi:FAD dependent oxidoreductase
VAVVEQADWAAGTSSRSTKLVHGGVRYLEKAVFNLDYSQLKLVWEALAERRAMLDAAPHLTRALPIMTVRALFCQVSLPCDLDTGLCGEQQLRSTYPAWLWLPCTARQFDVACSTAC